MATRPVRVPYSSSASPNRHRPRPRSCGRGASTSKLEEGECGRARALYERRVAAGGGTTYARFETESTLSAAVGRGDDPGFVMVDVPTDDGSVFAGAYKDIKGKSTREDVCVFISTSASPRALTSCSATGPPRGLGEGQGGVWRVRRHLRGGSDRARGLSRRRVDRTGGRRCVHAFAAALLRQCSTGSSVNDAVCGDSERESSAAFLPFQQAAQAWKSTQAHDPPGDCSQGTGDCH